MILNEFLESESMSSSPLKSPLKASDSKSPLKSSDSKSPLKSDSKSDAKHDSKSDAKHDSIIMSFLDVFGTLLLIVQKDLLLKGFIGPPSDQNQTSSHRQDFLLFYQKKLLQENNVKYYSRLISDTPSLVLQIKYQKRLKRLQKKML